jgi:hypothetical protein
VTVVRFQPLPEPVASVVVIAMVYVTVWSIPLKVKLGAGVVPFVSVSVPAATLAVPVVESAKATEEPAKTIMSRNVALTRKRRECTLRTVRATIKITLFLYTVSLFTGGVNREGKIVHRELSAYLNIKRGESKKIFLINIMMGL